MNAEEIRSTFSHNAVYSLNKDEGMLISLQIIAIGELAAQLAENNVLPGWQIWQFLWCSSANVTAA